MNEIEGGKSMEAFAFIALFIAIAIGCRLIAGMMNHERIRTYIKNKGGNVIRIVWTPFGPGWLGEKSDAIYEVDYHDRDGNHRRAHCKTSMFSGVYLHNDRLVSAAKPRQNRDNQEMTRQASMSVDEKNRRLEEENELLRREIESLKRNRF